MRIQLRYAESVLHPIRAALIRGSSPKSWLQEMNRWGIEPDAIECYVVPESVHSINPAGLFVVFKAAEALPQIDFLEPYGGLEERLFLPVNADLFPVVNPDELKKLLVWERQFFHPVIGLVGFTTDDAVDLADLLFISQPLKTNWQFAHPGLPAKPRLQQIRVLQPTADEVLESFKEGFQTQPLDQIPGKVEEAPSSDWQTRLTNWMKRKMRSEDLENKRKSEIARLINLFDENMEEALKYAIPLDSPYLNRGDAEPSSQLTARQTNLDFQNLGGGGPVDNWSVDEYYADLRKNYYLAATKAIEANNFKRAAYIYAHLLGDFPNAAKVLEQGKYYREAAILYKDHLKNLSQAANCLEMGGLLLEAIDVYLLLEKYEKVGDLYQTMNQSEKASIYYEQSGQLALAHQNFLEAARIMNDKLEQPERARQILLNGWKESNQAEQCLKQYFAGMKEDQALVNQSVQEVFSLHTSKPKRSSFLNVLVQLNESLNDTQLLETSRNLAYEIISEEAQEGNLANLYVLKKFLPGDQLIASDCSRYTNAHLSHSKLRVASAEFFLDKEIKWLTALSYRNQYVALGIKGASVHLVRGNWYRNFESYSWNHEVKANEQLKLIADPLYSRQVILYASSGLITEDKTLSKNRYFDQALQITSPAWLVPGFSGFAFNSEGGISALIAQSHQMSIHHYSAAMALKKSVHCKFENESSFLMSNSDMLGDITFRNSHYYTHKGSFLIRIAEEGETLRINIHANITRLVASHSASQFMIALATDKGSMLIKQHSFDQVLEDDFFAQDLVPIVAIQFVSTDKLVVAGKYQAKVYNIEQATPLLQYSFETHSPIVAILSPSHRHQIAFLEESGRIAICDTDPA